MIYDLRAKPWHGITIYAVRAALAMLMGLCVLTFGRVASAGLGYGGGVVVPGGAVTAQTISAAGGVTNAVTLSLDPASPTNSYTILNCPDSTFNGLYNGGYITNGTGFLKNANNRWLALYDITQGNGPALESNAVYDVSGAADWYDALGAYLPTVGWERTSDSTSLPNMAAYGMPLCIPAQTQLNAKSANIANLIQTNGVIWTSTNSGIWVSTEPGSTLGSRISQNTVSFDRKTSGSQNIFTLEAGINSGSSGLQFDSHGIFEEWKVNTNNQYSVMYAVNTQGHPDWNSRIGAYFFTPDRNDLGQFLVGWITKRGRDPDTTLVNGPAWFDVYGQDATSNCAAIWLDAGTLSSNSIPGCIQFNGLFYLTQTNAAGTGTNTLPVFLNGQDIPLVANGSGVTNIWWQTNFAKPTAPVGTSGIWVSNGWLYYITAQHPNGVLITAP